MTFRYIAGTLALILLMLVAGCVTSGGSNQTSPGTTKPVADPPIMIVNGEKINAADLLAFPPFRSPLRAYIYRVNLALEAERRGITADEGKLNERVEAQKQLAFDREQTWQEYLDEMNYTEAEFIAEKRDELLLEELVAADIDTSDAALREFFEANEEETINRYLKEYYLPESERGKLTFEDCKEFVRERKLQHEMFPARDALIRKLINNAELELLCFASAEEAEDFEDLILNKVRDQMNAEAEEAQSQAAAAGALEQGGAE